MHNKNPTPRRTLQRIFPPGAFFCFYDQIYMIIGWKRGTKTIYSGHNRRALEQQEITTHDVIMMTSQKNVIIRNWIWIQDMVDKQPEQYNIISGGNIKEWMINEERKDL